MGTVIAVIKSHNFALHRRVNNNILAKWGIWENYNLKSLLKTKLKK